MQQPPAEHQMPEKELPKPQFSMKWSFLTLLVLLFLISIVVFQVTSDEEDLLESGSGLDEQGGEEVEIEIDTQDWQVYQSEEFSFEISYPTDWQVSAHHPEQEDGAGFIVPAINIYNPDTLSDTELPFDHFADVVGVSIYPEGIPTEGVSGDHFDVSVQIEEDIEKALNYVLEDGTPWATIIWFRDPPESWEDYGYIWSRANVENLEISCIKYGEEGGPEQCEPLFGDRIVRQGEVDQKQRAILEEIVKSFRFLVE